jgi:hypothetical protein
MALHFRLRWYLYRVKRVQLASKLSKMGLTSGPTFVSSPLAGTTLIATVLKRFAVIEQHNPAIRILQPPAELSGFKYLMIWHPRKHGRRTRVVTRRDTPNRGELKKRKFAHCGVSRRTKVHEFPFLEFSPGTPSQVRAPSRRSRGALPSRSQRVHLLDFPQPRRHFTQLDLFCNNRGYTGL